MGAEGIPQEEVERTWLSRGLAAAVRLTLRAPKVSAAIGIAVAILAVFVAVQSLKFKTSRLDLLNPKSAYNQRWLAYLDEFGHKDDAIVVVEGTESAAVIETIEALAAEIARPNRPFEAVLYQRDFTKLRSKGLHFLNVDELNQVQGLVAKLQPVLDGDWNQLNAGRFIRELNQQVMQGASRGTTNAAAAALEREMLNAAVARFSDSLSGALQQTPEYRSPWPELQQLTTRFDQFRREYLLENEGRRGFILLRFQEIETKMVPGEAAIRELRQVIATVAKQFPKTTIGVTGMPVLEYDEMHSSQQDMTIASIVSLLGVIGLLIAGFGSLRHALLAVATLVIGMCWSFGFLTLAVGHLNLLSVSFAAILIGLGIDFGIHYLARFLQYRNEDQACDDALTNTVASIGPGIITGAVTTAFAFLTAGLTDFTGVAELGIIAGGGIMLCLAAALFFLPPTVAMLDRQRSHSSAASTLPLDKLLGLFFQFPKLTVVTLLMLCVAVAPGVSRLKYDHNLLNLQPLHTESVDLEKRLLAESDRSVWFAVSMARSRDELLAKKAAFEKLSSVERTEEITALIPVSHKDKQQVIAAVQRKLASLPATPPLIPVPNVQELLGELVKLDSILRAMGGGAQDSLAKVAQLRKQLAELSPETISQRLSDHQQRAAGELLTHLQALRELANPALPAWSDVPAGLTTRFLGKNDTHLLRVYARGDIWDMDLLSKFVADVEHVDPRVTGHPVQTFYASRQMQQSYIHAAIYSLIALLIVLMLDFRNVTHSLMALLPLAMGVWLMLGVLGLLEIPFNAANMIVLPLILGIGIDNGVHVIHDWRSQTGRFRLTNSIAVSMVLCSSTTMIGFSSMIFAKHQGLRSLGQVLTVGVFLCLSTSLLFLPALLIWLTRGRDESRERPPAGGNTARSARLSSVPSTSAHSETDTSSRSADDPSATDVDERQARRAARLRARRRS